MMVAFIDRRRVALGVESICRVVQFAPSAYYERTRQSAEPQSRSPRRKRDEALRTAIRREGFDVARCTIERLMREMGLWGVIRGRATRTTIPADRESRPLDLVQRRFRADRPNQLMSPTSPMSQPGRDSSTSPSSSMCSPG